MMKLSSTLKDDMMLKFENQVVLISGAGRGIGRQHALFFAERGAKVVVNDYGGGLHGENGNNSVPADEVVATIAAAGGTALAVCCDIGDGTQVEAMMAETIKRFGRIDVVIHNASSFAELSSFADAKLADLERIMRVNAMGGWNMAHAAWPHMLAQGYGRIVMTGSAAGFFGRLADHAYSMAKAALMPLTKVLAAEGAPSGIKVNMVGPIAFTENAAAQGFPPVIGKYAPPIYITHLVAALAHRECPVNGELFNSGCGYIGRVFTAETKGKVFSEGTLTPESVVASMDQIMDSNHFDIHATTVTAQERLIGYMAAAHPELAEILVKR